MEKNLLQQSSRACAWVGIASKQVQEGVGRDASFASRSRCIEATSRHLDRSFKIDDVGIFFRSCLDPKCSIGSKGGWTSIKVRARELLRRPVCFRENCISDARTSIRVDTWTTSEDGLVAGSGIDAEQHAERTLQAAIKVAWNQGALRYHINLNSTLSSWSRRAWGRIG